MYYIERFNQNFFVSGIGRPQWVGKIDSRQSFGTVYSGWYSEPDKLETVNNTATEASIYQMSKIIYINDYVYGYAVGQDKLYEVDYSDIAIPTFVEHDIGKGIILDICLDDNDTDNIYIATGSGVLDVDDLSVKLYRYDISTPGTPTVDAGPISFIFDDYPYSDASEDDPELEFANILSLDTDIYVMLNATGETEMKPWIETTATETCKFLYKGTYGATITLADNTPPMPTIRKSTSLDASFRKIAAVVTYNAGVVNLNVQVGVTGDYYNYYEAQLGSSQTINGNFGFYRENSVETNTRFNTIKNTLAVINGVVALSLKFSAGNICEGMNITWTNVQGGIDDEAYEPILYDITDKTFTYFITDNNSISNLLDYELTNEQQEMFGTDGTAIVGVQRRYPHTSKLGSGDYELSIDSGDNTVIKGNRPTTNEIILRALTGSTRTIEDTNLIFDVYSLSSIVIYVLTAHRNQGTLGTGNYNSTTQVLTLDEATVTAAFDIYDSATADATFDKSVVYQYKLSCLYDEYQEGPLSSISLSPNNHTDWDDVGTDNIIAVGMIVKMQTIPSKRISHINIYRADGDAYYRLIKSIPIEQFSENGLYYEHELVDDGSALASFDALNGYSQELDSVSLNYDIMTQFNGYLYVAGVAFLDGENTMNYLFRSKPGRFSVFDWSNDFVKVDFEISTILSHNGEILVANENSIAIVDSEQMYIKKYVHGTGCDGQQYIKDTPYGLVFLGNDTVYVWDGKQIHDIGVIISQGTASLSDVTIERLEYDSVLKKIYLFGIFSSTDLNYFSYSFEDKRWDMGVAIETGTGISITGTFNDILGKVYITYDVPIIESTYWDGTDVYDDGLGDDYIDGE